MMRSHDWQPLRATPQPLPAASGRVSLVARSGLDQPPGADQVVGQGVPQGDGLDLLQAAHKELRQSPIARLSVGAFSGRRALLVDVLGLATAHALAPFGDTRLVAREWRMRVAAGIARLRHWCEDFDAV